MASLLREQAEAEAAEAAVLGATEPETAVEPVAVMARARNQIAAAEGGERLPSSIPTGRAGLAVPASSSSATR